MKDYLQDLIEHTHGLGCIELVKVTGTDKVTQIAAISEDKNVILEGEFNAPVADFIGTFGMPNLTKLKTILGLNDYDNESKISMKRGTADDPNAPANIHFETKLGDFVNDYRLMNKTLVEEKVKTIKLKVTPVWNVEFEPTVAGIMRLKSQVTANSEEVHVTVKTENSELKMYFGDPSTHSGNFVFHQSVTGTLKNKQVWSVKQFQAIMELSGDKKVRLSDQGLAEITVDSGLAVYRYFLPSQSK